MTKKIIKNNKVVMPLPETEYATDLFKIRRNINYVEAPDPNQAKIDSLYVPEHWNYDGDWVLNEDISKAMTRSAKLSFDEFKQISGNNKENNIR